MWHRTAFPLFSSWHCMVIRFIYTKSFALCIRSYLVYWQLSDRSERPVVYMLYESLFVSFSSFDTQARLLPTRQGFDSNQGCVSEFFSSPPRPDRLWVPPSLLSDGWRPFSREWSWAHISVMRLRICGLYLHSPIHIHGVVLSFKKNALRFAATLPSSVTVYLYLFARCQYKDVPIFII
jgi:hypothetical protein